MRRMAVAGACLLGTGFAWAAEAPLSALRLPPPPAISEFESSISQGAVRVRAIRIDGNKTLPDQAFADVIKEFTGRDLNVTQMRGLERRLTQVYRDNGFVTSGVILRSQAVTDETLVLLAVEGTVSQVRLTQKPRWSRPGFLTREIVPAPDAPLNLPDLQERLALLRDSGIVDRVNAELVPLARLGESELILEVEEGNPLHVALSYDNRRSPTIGARRAELSFLHQNMTGWGDELEARVGSTHGVKDGFVRYLSPRQLFSTRIGLRWDRSDSVAIDPPVFRSLDIKSDTITRGLDLVHTLARKADVTAESSLSAEKRTSDTTLLGFPFSFIPGIADGESRINVLRLAINVTRKTEDRAHYLRAQFSAGRTNVADDALSGLAPAQRFRTLAWQYQFARRFETGKLQFIGRFQGQLTRDYLLPLEKLSLTGADAVRGYRESLVIRDRAVIGAAEVQMPLVSFGERASVHGAVFSDVAWGENVNQVADDLPKQLASIGVGLLVRSNAGLSAAVYVARPNHRWLTKKLDAQDRGLHFSLHYRY